MSGSTRSRREFLAQAASGLGFLGVGSSVFDQAFSSIWKAAASKAVADAPLPPVAYVHITFPGAPPRWIFDLPLMPSGNSADVLPGGFGNSIEFVAGSPRATIQAERHVVSGKTLWLPPVWSKGLSSADFGSLLSNTAFIRGIDMEIDGHLLGNGRQVAPIINGISLSGIAADAASCPIPAILADSGANGAAKSFRSKKGAAASYAPNTSTPVADLMRPFKAFNAVSAPYQGIQWRAKQNDALAKMEAFSKASGTHSSVLSEAYDAAIDMIRSDAAQISSQWGDILPPYQALITQVLSPDSVNIQFPNAIPADGAATFNVSTPGEGERVQMPDLRTVFVGTKSALPTIPNMAERFALAEILLLNDVTSSLTLVMQPTENLGFPGGTSTFVHDQHHAGSITGTFVNSVYYRAFLACLTRFVARLKAAGRFDRTILHITSEFNRRPRLDGAGSDHGPTGSNVTLISGMISRPSIIGNLVKNPAEGAYGGTWGHAAPYELFGENRPIQVNDVAQTIAAMMNQSSEGLVTNGRLLLNAATGLPFKEEANNV